ncbi:alpha/beta hydrolase [Pseudomonas luteola]|uniref:RBBP9/YdeN family alpha/beta hydrolase n=1 Tax=Pseudomonas luteola TaxID=47886 RepID=UPI000F77AA9F|nr:alpha/beta hydrolase [Pseudomonas luteola]MCG7374113.1 alpha/beta hydrolase [Pseudomonas luteola]RRW39555.1 alpha/beta hydrolase [Pseudomonas luteola]
MNQSVLIVPGIGNSGAQHWQTLWQAKHPHWQRLDVEDWDQVGCRAWVDATDRQVSNLGPGTLIVAHSLGCLVVAHWAARSSHCSRVQGALLVAVPDPESPFFPSSSTSGFNRTPEILFPFPCLVLASADDPYASPDYSKQWAESRGARWVNMGARGHLNASSGLGEWPEGYQLLQGLNQEPFD